jgi:CHAT domain-containing protein
VSSLRAFGEAARPDYQVELTGYGNPVLGPPQEPAPARATRRTGTRFADVAAIKAMASLPGTERELLALAAGLGVPRDALRLGARATESAVKQDPLLGRSRVVVFATHGVLPGGQAGFQEPGLIFTPPGSPSAQDDGLLTASEAASLTLPADWLILSACNTAASDGRPGGEALSGLARSFLYAGARSLLASHWQVSDDATAALTVEALRVARARPQLSRAQAMQEAMRAVRTGKTAEGTALAGWKPEWADPWYWAPFVLIESGS